jgi:hypothetical protein
MITTSSQPTLPSKFYEECSFFARRIREKIQRAGKKTDTLRLHIIGRGVELLGRWLREEARLFGREMSRMKKLILLTAVGVLMVGSAGCRSCDWFHRGAPARAVTMPAPMYYDPCATSGDPCTPGPAACTPGATMMVAPGPDATFVPGPAR